MSLHSSEQWLNVGEFGPPAEAFTFALEGNEQFCNQLSASSELSSLQIALRALNINACADESSQTSGISRPEELAHIFLIDDSSGDFQPGLEELVRPYFCVEGVRPQIIRSRHGLVFIIGVVYAREFIHKHGEDNWLRIVQQVARGEDISIEGESRDVLRTYDDITFTHRDSLLEQIRQRVANQVISRTPCPNNQPMERQNELTLDNQSLEEVMDNLMNGHAQEQEPGTVEAVYHYVNGVVESITFRSDHIGETMRVTGGSDLHVIRPEVQWSSWSSFINSVEEGILNVRANRMPGEETALGRLRTSLIHGLYAMEIVPVPIVGTSDQPGTPVVIDRNIPVTFYEQTYERLEIMDPPPFGNQPIRVIVEFEINIYSSTPIPQDYRLVRIEREVDVPGLVRNIGNQTAIMAQDARLSAARWQLVERLLVMIPYIGDVFSYVDLSDLFLNDTSGNPVQIPGPLGTMLEAYEQVVAVTNSSQRAALRDGFWHGIMWWPPYNNPPSQYADMYRIGNQAGVRIQPRLYDRLWEQIRPDLSREVINTINRNNNPDELRNNIIAAILRDSNTRDREELFRTFLNYSPEIRDFIADNS